MKQYVVDAFSEKVFGGNPAAVCVMEQWIDEDLMQSIAIENNLSETAFAVREAKGYRLRWFTPGGEIDLCGHATLATAFVIMNHIEPDLQEIDFHTLSGTLHVSRKDDLYELDFPAYELAEVPVSDAMCEALGARPQQALLGRDLLCIFEDEQIILDMAPDAKKLMGLDGLLVNVTAPGTTHDLVSRSFAPKIGVYEDPVCGSGHCHIIPYWAKRLGKENFVAIRPRRAEEPCTAR